MQQRLFELRPERRLVSRLLDEELSSPHAIKMPTTLVRRNRSACAFDCQSPTATDNLTAGGQSHCETLP